MSFKTLFFSDVDSGNINCRNNCYEATSDCHMDYYFYILGGLQLLGIVGLYVLNKWLKLSQDQTVLGTAEAGNVNNPAGILNQHRSRSSGRRSGYRSDRSRPTTPRAVNDGDASTNTESSTNENDGVRSGTHAQAPVHKRSIRRDQTGRIGGFTE